LLNRKPISLPANFEFHHLGYATASISIESELLSFLGYCQEGETFIDTIQGVKGCFYNGSGPRIELLENLPNSHTLTPWLKNGIKFYHVAYTVSNMNESLNWAKNQRARIIVDPVSAVAFSGRLISFIIFRNGLLIELIENN